MFNPKLIIRTIGFLLMVESIFMLFPVMTAILYGEPVLEDLCTGILVTGGVGGLFFFSCRKVEKKISKNDGFIIVSLIWILFALFGSLPYLLTGTIPNFTNAFFESISGFTTTGASILSNFEQIPRSILLWRSLTQWMGGMGIIVLGMAVLPIFGIGGMELFTADIPRPTAETTKFKLKQTVFNLWFIYIGITLLEILLLWLGPMNLYDAINHSFTTISSGGFSTHKDSIAHWNSPYIEYVISFFMLIAGINLPLIYAAFKGKFAKLFRNEELKYYLLFIIAATAIVYSGILMFTSTGFGKAFRESIFQVIAIISTTGFTTVNYSGWPLYLLLFMFMLFFMGACSGSTGGGMKVMRILLLLKNGYYEVRRSLHPSAVIPVRLNRKAVSDEIITNVLAFLMIYLFIFFISTLLFTFMNLDITAAMGTAASALGNIGPGIKATNPTESYAQLPVIGKWLFSFLMLLGRLELFTILVLFSPSFWKE